MLSKSGKNFFLTNLKSNPGNFRAFHSRQIQTQEKKRNGIPTS
jgi:hypothetical protein